MHGIGVWLVHGDFGVGINYVSYYLDGGVVGLVRLDLGVGVWFWMRYGDVINMSLSISGESKQGVV